MALLNENIAQTISDFNDIKAKIIENGVDVPDGTKTSEYAGKIEDVYGIGYAQGETVGFEDGKTAEFNEIWDGLQSYGGRTDYTKFCSSSYFMLKDNNNKYYWNFKPKYNLNIKTGNSMFKSFNSSSSGGINHSEIAIDLTQWLEDLDIDWNTSGLTDANYMFYNCQGISRAPFLNFSKCTSSNSLANFCGQSAVLKTIDGIKSSESTNWVSTTFTTNNPLTHCIFTGVISKTFYISNAKNLDKESIISVINTLSETTSGLTATLSKSAVTKAFGSTESDEWLNLIATKSNWTITLS